MKIQTIPNGDYRSFKSQIDIAVNEYLDYLENLLYYKKIDNETFKENVGYLIKAINKERHYLENEHEKS